MVLSFVYLNIFVPFTGVLAASTVNFAVDSRLANTALQKWYNTTSGVWDSAGWWNSANCLTIVGNLAAQDRKVKKMAIEIFENTHVQAPKFKEGLEKVVESDYMIHALSYGISSWPQENLKAGFTNEFYDDGGWWALGWIQAFDVTGRQDYLQTAIDIFDDMEAGATTPCNGGIWWDKNQTYVNAISNELYLSVAAHLANRVSGKDQKRFRHIAENQWRWFSNSGMINSQSVINDGLTDDCKNNNGAIWSYNQGVIVGGLVELSKATSNRSHIIRAKEIATAAIHNLTDANGVLHDPCEPNCGNDGAQFKGIFVRNLHMLQVASPEKKFLSFIKTNAASILTRNKSKDHRFGINWAGPFIGPANASTQSSAMDALVSAASLRIFANRDHLTIQDRTRLDR